MSSATKLYIYFALVKLAGYVVAGLFLARHYEESSATGVCAGITRTLIGKGTGALLYSTTAGLAANCRVGRGFWLFFGRPFKRPVAFMLLMAIWWSYALDVTGAIFGLVVSGTGIC